MSDTPDHTALADAGRKHTEPDTGTTAQRRPRREIIRELEARVTRLEARLDSVERSTESPPNSDDGRKTPRHLTPHVRTPEEDDLGDRLTAVETTLEELCEQIDEQATVTMSGETSRLANLRVDGVPIGRRLDAAVERLDALVTLICGDAHATPDDIDATIQDRSLTADARLARTLAVLLLGDHDDHTSVAQELYDNHGPWNAQLAKLSEVDSDLKAELREEIDRKVGTLRAQHGVMFDDIAAELDLNLREDATDKISRVIRDGIDAVENQPSKRQRRAELVLQSIEEWGQRTKIRAGRCYKLERPQIQRLLSASGDVSITMSSKTTGDVFDEIERLAETSSRFTRRRKDDGTDVLYVGWPTRGE